MLRRKGAATLSYWKLLDNNSNATFTADAVTNPGSKPTIAGEADAGTKTERTYIGSCTTSTKDARTAG